MILEYVRYDVPAAQDEAFRQAWARSTEVLRRSPECLGVEVSRCAEDATMYIVRLTWTSKEGHLEVFRKSEVFRDLVKEVGPFVPLILEMKHYDVLDGGWTRP